MPRNKGSDTPMDAAMDAAYDPDAAAQWLIVANYGDGPMVVAVANLRDADATELEVIPTTPAGRVCGRPQRYKNNRRPTMALARNFLGIKRHDCVTLHYQPI